MADENTAIIAEVNKIEGSLEKDTGSSIRKTDAEVKNIEKVIEERKKKILQGILGGKQWFIFLILGLIVWMSIYIRTRNLLGLRDITTNSWTLGPDLDPFLFLRYAKYIVEHGSLMIIDQMRYVPLGFKTAVETRLLPYLIAYLYHILVFFQRILPFQEITVDLAGVLFPVVMFAFTVIAFFFLVRKIFDDKSYKDLIALLATLLMVVSPPLLSRTISGIPEKESAIVFLFAAFYFFLRSWNEKSLMRVIVFGIFSGAMSALMGLIWGGVVYLYLTISLSTFIAFLIGKIDKRRAIAYSIWLVSFNTILFSFTQRYSLLGYLVNPFSAILYLNLLMILLYHGIPKFFTLQIARRKIPLELAVFGIALLISLAGAFFILGPGEIASKAEGIINTFINPVRDRFGLTVAENRQPYFGEWRGSFGPELRGIPLFFWLFFTGSIALFYHMLSHFDMKRRLLFTGLYTLMLFGIIFSRYDPSSDFNGLNFQSKAAYFGSILLFIGVLGCSYFKELREGKHTFQTINFSYLLLFVYFFVTLASARSAVRLIMMLTPPAAILIGFLAVFLFFTYRENKGKYKLLILVAVILVITATAYTAYVHYQISRNSAQGFVPSPYTQQWQRAMSWVRNTTSINAVFAHWWDYGYWVQSIGERATVLDGSNLIVYWDHLMGRHVLTGSDINNSLTFLYTHNATHLLIDSTDIGKYGAYASIGGDANHDRASFIPTLVKDEQQTFETRDETVFVYPSGFGLDEDIIWENNGSRQIFHAGTDGIAGFLIKINKNSSQMKQPEAIILHQNSQVRVPVRFIFYNNQLIDFQSGIDAGVMIIPRLIPQGNQVSADPIGSLLYFSKRTIHSFVVRLYLFNEKNESFTLVYSEPHPYIENLRQQGLQTGDFISFGDLVGPIKIWEVNYSQKIKENREWLKTEFPDLALVF